jgi:phosphoglycolate phosphatase
MVDRKLSFDTIFFDLDGTLTDPRIGITNSFSYALSYFGISENPENLTKVIGPPLLDSFTRFYGFSEEKGRLAIEKYREYFRDRGIFENSLYPEVPDLLKSLTEGGKKLLIASSKPTVFVEQILNHFQIASYFSEVVGSELDGRRGQKQEVVAEAILRSGADRNRSVLVGDRIYDIQGAALCGLPAIGVLWGYGKPEEFQNAFAVVSQVSDLRKILLNESVQSTK